MPSTPSPNSSTTPAAAAAARALLQSAAESVARGSSSVGTPGSTSSRRGTNKQKRYKRKADSRNRGAYAPLLLDDVSTPGSVRGGSARDSYFQLGGEDSDSDIDSDMEASFTSADRLVNGSRQATPHSHIFSAPIRPDVPSMLDLPAEPAFTGPQSYTDSLVSLPADFVNPVTHVTPLSDADFLAIIDEVKAAISEGIYPTLIAQGSSGSYFCRNRQGEIVGVFKPKNEEPYGHLNPKWTKWIHRNLFPCCFGRSCIIPNLGYISEAAASYMDRRLGLNVTPRTEVVLLASPTFYYSRKDWKAYRAGKVLPEKMGSFQTFLRGFKDATQFFREGYERVRAAGDASGGVGAGGGWSDRAKSEFQWGFERLVVLDYLVRQTDRGLDNWMVRWDEAEEKKVKEGVAAAAAAATAGTGGDEQKEGQLINVGEDEAGASESSEAIEATAAIEGTAASTSSAQPQPTTSIAPVTPPSSPPLVPASSPTIPDRKDTPPPTDIPTPTLPRPIVQIAAIDNGLAFPYKHPDRWRSYPYGWSVLPIARTPFSRETRTQILHLLTSSEWWRETLDGLERLFRIDKDFSESMWRKQRAVVRGEGYNLVEVLRRAENWEAGFLSSGNNPLGTSFDSLLSVGSQTVSRRTGLDGSPFGLVRRPVVCVFEEVVEEDEEGLSPGAIGGDLEEGGRPGLPRRKSFVERGVERGKRRLKRVKQRFETFTRRQPCFTSW
ncbi:phosphatidyl inositol kinase [Rhizophlyctis rosea]|nr:phosphatidyl inositol kinase [Rhizophlyctis rosea]